ncbi:hypothetical protein OG564_28680 [Streptomyces sp. NBC_01280]|uniref:hypothetical protein n=1 Tax=Streptomyces sp. NBC_01280 TaxID=2903810 RepID=UPI002E30D6B4|nr:hypothetical protein [Streptomyces sp. NBC_01280]
MKNSDPAVLEALDLAWDDEEGVLGKLRGGQFDAALAEGYVELLQTIEIEEGAALHADFVRLIWFAPLFSEWQIERVAKRGGDAQEASNFSDKVRERVMELLGTP